MKCRLLFFLPVFVLFCSCSPSRQIAKSARQNVLQDSALQTAHVGISIYEPATGKYWFNYQGDNYFVPASNTKLPTCYAAMKYLGDSLVGLRYGIPEEGGWKDNIIAIDASGDPSFLHLDYLNQSSFRFLQDSIQKSRRQPGILVKKNEVERWGNGWSWNDYEASYMVERSVLPIFGNTISIHLKDTSQRFVPHPLSPWLKIPKPFVTNAKLFDSLVNKYVLARNALKETFPRLRISRSIGENHFLIETGSSQFMGIEIPFVTNNLGTAIQILSDTLGKQFAIVESTGEKNKYAWLSEDGGISFFHIDKWNILHSQPTDSLLKPMMHRSDNFFAEQTLLMVSNEFLGVMNDAKIIDTILKTDFKDLPQKPRWADGSGLSRYNLFTPQDFVFILNKMKNDFGMDRIREILPTGGEGTLSSYYQNEKGFIYAKTGTLSGVVALSGFLYTKKEKLLIFSVLVNNHNASATQVRRAVEKFVIGIRNKY